MNKLFFLIPLLIVGCKVKQPLPEVVAFIKSLRVGERDEQVVRIWPQEDTHKVTKVAVLNKLDFTVTYTKKPEDLPAFTFRSCNSGSLPAGVACQTTLRTHPTVEGDLATELTVTFENTGTGEIFDKNIPVTATATQAEGPLPH